MTLIAVIADTHVPDAASGAALAQRLLASPLGAAQMWLHAGDIVCPDWFWLLADKTVLAVRGNCDPAAADLPWQRLLTVDGARIGLIHGWGAAEGLERRVAESFAAEAPRVLVYGHSHRPLCQWRDDVLFLNPGSAAGLRCAGATAALLHLHNGRATADIIDLPPP